MIDIDEQLNNQEKMMLKNILFQASEYERVMDRAIGIMSGSQIAYCAWVLACANTIKRIYNVKQGDPVYQGHMRELIRESLKEVLEEGNEDTANSSFMGW